MESIAFPERSRQQEACRDSKASSRNLATRTPDRLIFQQPPALRGVTLLPKQHVAEFRKAEQSWRQYRDTACTAAFHQFDGGTGGPSFELECELKLDRSHMHELDMIYGEDLHL